MPTEAPWVDKGGRYMDDGMEGLFVVFTSWGKRTCIYIYREREMQKLVNPSLVCTSLQLVSTSCIYFEAFSSDLVTLRVYLTDNPRRLLTSFASACRPSFSLFF